MRWDTGRLDHHIALEEPGESGRGLSTNALWLIVGVCAAATVGLAITDAADPAWRFAALAGSSAAAIACLAVILHRRRATP